MTSAVKAVSLSKKIKENRARKLEARPAFPIAKIEAPRRGEIVTSATYCMRIAAPFGLGQAEISIDHGLWQPCRYGNGCWRYEWSGYSTGEHYVVARVPMQDGLMCTTWPHRFTVQL